MQNKKGERLKDGRNEAKKKKVDLSKEFDEFKQRIQEFEDKNEEIINRIRDAYSHRKRAQQPTIYYEATPEVPPLRYD